MASVASAGVELVRKGSTLIDRSAQALAGAAASAAPAPEATGELAVISRALVDVARGSFLFHAGVALIGVARESERALLDIFA